MITVTYSSRCSLSFPYPSMTGTQCLPYKYYCLTTKTFCLIGRPCDFLTSFMTQIVLTAIPLYVGQFNNKTNESKTESFYKLFALFIIHIFL